MTAEVCRESNAGPLSSAAKPVVCRPVRRLLVAPGASEVTDTLPPALQADPVSLLSYRIQIFNATGHSAGESATPAYAAAGLAPTEVSSFQARASERGAILEWRSATAMKSGTVDLVDFTRTDLLMPSSKEKTAINGMLGTSKTRQPDKTALDAINRVHLEAPDIPAKPQSESAGTVDTTAEMGGSYSYIAVRVRKINVGNHKLQILSEPSTTVTLAMKDTFPPGVPTGLASIAGHRARDSSAPGSDVQEAQYIDLSWEPNGESDLEGYRVYRQLAGPDGLPQGPLQRLTAFPISVPAYRDVAVRAGRGYIYSVTAVDATGNESAPSAKVLEVLSPDSGEPPH